MKGIYYRETKNQEELKADFERLKKVKAELESASAHKLDEECKQETLTIEQSCYMLANLSISQ